jgi:hypothetical protein
MIDLNLARFKAELPTLFESSKAMCDYNQITGGGSRFHKGIAGEAQICIIEYLHRLDNVSTL